MVTIYYLLVYADLYIHNLCHKFCLVANSCIKVVNFNNCCCIHRCSSLGSTTGDPHSMIIKTPTGVHAVTTANHIINQWVIYQHFVLYNFVK